MSGTEWPDLERAAEARQILHELAADRAEVKRLRAEIERLRHENMRLQTANEYSFNELAARNREIERLRGERDELFLENGRLANTIGVENLRLRAALVALTSEISHDQGLMDRISLRNYEDACAALTGGKE